MLELKNLNFAYQVKDQRHTIIDDCSYRFENGRFYTILGPSGAGKTTLMSLMSGLTRSTPATIFYNEVPLEKIGYTRYRHDHISIVFQQYNLIDYLTAFENVYVTLLDHDPHNHNKDLVYAILEKVGITKTKAARLGQNLSGGEQQRVAIAKALASNTDIIFADEPTGNLDEETTYAITALFQRLSHEFNKTIITVTHSRIVAAQSDIQTLLENGKIKERTEQTI